MSTSKEIEVVATTTTTVEYFDVENQVQGEAEEVVDAEEFEWGDELGCKCECFSAITSLILYGSLGTFLVLFFLNGLEEAKIALYVAFGAIGIYFFEAILLQCCLPSGIVSDIRFPKETEVAVFFMKLAREATPQLSIYIECYHYETRTTTTTDSNGRTQTHTRTEKVTTYTASEPVRYSEWKDVSPLSSIESGQHADDILRRKNILLKYTLRYTYSADQETMAAFNAQKDVFFNLNRRDAHQNCYFIYSTGSSGTRTLTVKSEKSKKSRCFSLGTYYFYTLIGLTWAYRMYIEKYTDRRLWVNNKRLYI